MKAAIVFTGTGPILILSTYESLEEKKLHAALHDKGISKFILREVAVENVEKRYGGRFNNLKSEMHDNDMRVLDYNGNQVFVNFEFPDLGTAVEVEDDVVLP